MTWLLYAVAALAAAGEAAAAADTSAVTTTQFVPDRHDSVAAATTGPSDEATGYDAGLGGPRRLFSQNYVDGGCKGEPPKNTKEDNTLGCYATNYLILCIGVLGSLPFAARVRWPSSGDPGARALDAAYGLFFALTGLGYGAAGVLHHGLIVRPARAPSGWVATPYVVVLLGNASLCAAGALLTRGVAAPSTLWKAGVAVTALLNVVVIVLVGTTHDMQPCGVFTMLTLVVMIGVWVKTTAGARAAAVKATAGATMISGMIAQAVLASTCGDAGYEDCFRDCPLPAPEFNHNALFHLLYAVGLLVLAVGLLCDEATGLLCDEATPLLCDEATEKQTDTVKQAEKAADRV